MLVFSFLFDLVSKLLKKREWNTAGLLCLIVGTLGAVAAVLTGPNPWRHPLWPDHSLFGTITMYLAVALTLVRLVFLFRVKIEIGNRWAYLPASFIVLLLISYTGHLGGQIVHPDRTKPPALSTQQIPASNK
jgi:uncharacterized membrane protein